MPTTKEIRDFWDRNAMRADQHRAEVFAGVAKLLMILLALGAVTLSSIGIGLWLILR